jgi:hypothetical protein
VTDPDPNETARMPTPGDAGTQPAEGWPGTTARPDEVAPPDSSSVGASPPSDVAPPEDEIGQPTAGPDLSGPAVAEPALAEPAVAGAWTAAAAPARRGDEPDHGRAASVVFGFILLAIGLWFFVEQTLGIELPRVRWSQFWPVILIGLGVWIVLGSMRRRSR